MENVGEAYLASQGCAEPGQEGRAQRDLRCKRCSLYFTACKKCLIVLITICDHLKDDLNF